MSASYPWMIETSLANQLSPFSVYYSISRETQLATNKGPLERKKEKCDDGESARCTIFRCREKPTSSVLTIAKKDAYDLGIHATWKTSKEIVVMHSRRKSNRTRICTATAWSATCVLLFALSVIPAWGASHSDAPLIKQDPQANLTDVYAFIGTKYDNPSQKVLNVVAHVRPFSDPGDGVMYERFADDAIYTIYITNPTTGEIVRRYDFEFSDTNPLSPPGLKNPDTILSYGVGTEVGPIVTVGDARQNYVQTYRVITGTGMPTTKRRENDRRRVIAEGLLVPPPNVGKRTTPAYNDVNGKAVSGAASFAGLDAYTQQTIYSLPSGEAVFAGPREDGFFADTPGIFDTLDPRILDHNGSLDDGLGQDGSGVDGFKGFNVLAYAVQIPLSSLPTFSYTDPFFGASSGVGVYAAVSRRRITLRSKNADRDPRQEGSFVQVNRMGNPLFNEVLVALRDKDRYNRTSPTTDAALATYALNPEVAFLINFVFGTSFATTGRTDLQAVYIPDVLRVDTTTDPVPLAGQPGFSRLGFIGGDMTSGKSSGWPNGRRLGDDVVDIALTAVASGPTYSSITVVGDNVAANDQLYHQVFPYSATPHAGPTVDQRTAP